MRPCTSRRKCIRAAPCSDSDNKNLPRIPVDLACALGVRTDDLIFDKDTLGKDELLEEITLELDGCSKEQLLTLRQILSSSKEAIQKYLER